MSSLESQLRKAGRELADHQVARLFKVPEELAQTPCDFFGFTAAGRAILIEAKEVRRSSLPVGSAPGMRPHQWAELVSAHRAGCVALICWSRNGTVATIDMDIAERLVWKRKSISWDSIPERFKHDLSDTLQLLEPYVSCR